jgi:hypothetical protein
MLHILGYGTQTNEPKQQVFEEAEIEELAHS